MVIPAWNSAGVLPPLRPTSASNSTDRSPYRIELSVLVDHFAFSPERRVILEGLLRFRAALHQAGITSGFQWLDGSFMEQVELLENRAPRDMDVVNFVNLTGMNQQALAANHAALFDPQQTKNHYSVDAYYVQIGLPLNNESVRRVSYWYSMWSHRRDGLWKGFVQVDLDPAQDVQARALLNLIGGAV